MYKDMILYVRSYAKVTALVCVLSVSAILSNYTYAQTCESVFKVEKDRNFRSVDQDGTTYWLSLTNLSSFQKTYTVDLTDLVSPCNNNIHPMTGPNVSLELEVLDENSNPIGTQINVAAGQTYRFQINVSVPDGTTLERWSCVEVKVNTNNCVNTLSTNLSIYVPDPSQE